VARAVENNSLVRECEVKIGWQECGRKCCDRESHAKCDRVIGCEKPHNPSLVVSSFFWPTGGASSGFSSL
jgi:hypothetical protein